MLCPKKRKLSDSDHLGQFLLRFHTLIDLYDMSFLVENQFLNLFNVFSYVIVHFVPLPCLLST